jgi:uncharacterized protein (TIGR03066 family)
MNRLIITLLACLGVAIVGTSAFVARVGAADDKKTPINKDLIVGKWEVVKSGDVPVGTLFEFKADGSLILSLSIKGKTMKSEETYKVDGNKILHAEKGSKDKPEAETIKSLTADKMVTTNPGGRETEFKKKK